MDVVQAKEEDTLEMLKNSILMMPRFAEYNATPDRLRLRELRKDMFFGRVLKGHNKTLKKLGLETNMGLVVQVKIILICSEM